MQQAHYFSVNYVQSVEGDKYIFTRSNEETSITANDPFDVLKLAKSDFPKLMRIGTHSLLELNEFTIIDPRTRKLSAI
jgi:hypothetical protein